jgi:hypothetical protein
MPNCGKENKKSLNYLIVKALVVRTGIEPVFHP